MTATLFHMRIAFLAGLIFVVLCLGWAFFRRSG
jgi:hypothetical protein